MEIVYWIYEEMMTNIIVMFINFSHQLQVSWFRELSRRNKVLISRTVNIRNREMQVCMGNFLAEGYLKFRTSDHL